MRKSSQTIQIPTTTSLIKTFAENLTSVNGLCPIVPNYEDAASLVSTLVDSEIDQCIIINETPIVKKFLAADEKLMKTIGTNTATRTFQTPMDFTSISLGITSAKWLVARTGSVICQTSEIVGWCSISFPSHLVVIAEGRTILNSLDDVFRNIGGKNSLCSYFTIMTGPSRTADIEK